jgi:serine/threonine protein kinase
MDQVVPKDAWCLWQHLGAAGAPAPAVGEDIIVRRPDAVDPEMGEFTFKRLVETPEGRKLAPMSHQPGTPPDLARARRRSDIWESRKMAARRRPRGALHHRGFASISASPHKNQLKVGSGRHEACFAAAELLLRHRVADDRFFEKLRSEFPMRSNDIDAAAAAVVPAAVVGSNGLIGAVLGERYRVTEQIGTGRSGGVYLALDRSLGDRKVALKVVSLGLLHTPQAREEFEAHFTHEAQLTARIHHESIVVVHDRGRDRSRGVVYLAMEYLAGVSLEQLITSAPHHRLPADHAIRLLAQMCGALAEAHAHGQIHGDLKPSNLMVLTRADGSELLKVLDFGLHKRLLRTGASDYLAPEQIRLRDGAPLDARTDVYAAGCIAYHMLSGAPPFARYARDGDDAVLQAHLERAPERLDRVDRIDRIMDITPALADVIERALAKEPTARFADMQALRRALERTARPMPAANERAPAPNSEPQPTRLHERGRLQLPSLWQDVVGAEHPSLVATRGGHALLFQHAIDGATQVCYHPLALPRLAERTPVGLTSSPGSAIRPAAVTTDAGILLAWIEARSGRPAGEEGPQIHAGVILDAQRADPRAVLGEGRQLTHCRGLVGAPSLAAIPSGGALLLWHELRQDSTAIQMMRLDRAAAPQSPSRTIGQGACPVAALGPERGLVAWHERRSGEFTVLVLALRGREELDVAGPPRRLLTETDAALPAIVRRVDHGFVLACWTGKPHPAITVLRLSDDGSVAGELAVLSAAAPVPHRPALTVRGDDVLVAWTEIVDGSAALTVSCMHGWARDGADQAPPQHLRLTPAPAPNGGPVLVAAQGSALVGWQVPGRGAPSLLVAHLVAEAS